MAGNGNLFEDMFGSPDEDKEAEKYLRQVLGAYDGAREPELGPVQYDDYKYGGDYSPQGVLNAETVDNPDRVSASLADAAQMDGTSFDGVNTDPRLKSSQMDALASMQEIGQGGMTASDKAQLARIQSDANAADRGRRDAVMQNMRARGMGGSGMELLANLQSSQAATDQQAQQGLDVAGMAQQRALAALAQGGQMAGSMRGQDFDEQARKAQARDTIAQFNAANRQQAGQFNAGQQNNMGQFNAGMQADTARFNAGQRQQAGQFNAGARNAAGMAGWEARQNVANQNTQLRNQSAYQNQVELPQQRFENQEQMRRGKAAAAQTGVDYWNKAGDRKSKWKGQMAQGGAAAIGAIGAMMSDEREKKDVSQLSDDEISEFLAAVQPKKFKYKDGNKPGTLPGERVGFIAQDVADAGAGKSLISKTDDGTMQYDPVNLQGIMLAAIKQLAEKVDKKDDE